MSRTSRWRPRVPPLPPEVPASRNHLARWIGRKVMAIAGWSIEGDVPALSKFVVVVAPHTSNWDFIIGIAMKWALDIEVHWIGKHTLFRGPLGLLMRALGGMPVNRDSPQGLVRRVAQMFESRTRFVLGLAPEGTRRPGSPWKSGFWHIARAAGVPVVPVSIDFGRRRCGIGVPAILTDDYESDLAGFRSFYATVRGVRSEPAAPSRS